MGRGSAGHSGVGDCCEGALGLGSGMSALAFCDVMLRALRSFASLSALWFEKEVGWRETPSVFFNRGREEREAERDGKAMSC